MQIIPRHVDLRGAYFNKNLSEVHIIAFAEQV